MGIVSNVTSIFVLRKIKCDNLFILDTSHFGHAGLNLSLFASAPKCQGAVLEATMCGWYVRPISSTRKRMHVTLTLQSHAQLSS